MFEFRLYKFNMKHFTVNKETKINYKNKYAELEMCTTQ
jgi:hypothetical protein